MNYLYRVVYTKIKNLEQYEERTQFGYICICISIG